MRSSPLWFVTLLLAGAHDCLIASYHFVLPFQFGWRRGLHGVPDSIVWTLYALNFSWSLLLLLTGALVLYAAFLGPSAGLFARRMIFAVGLFWAIHGVYTWINPFPLPHSLAWLGIVMAAFPAITITLHWLPLIATRAETVSSTSAIAIDRG
jgi:hypothetical protein